MPETYGPQARAALMQLMLEDRAIPHKELTDRFKIKLPPAVRGPLNDGDLMSTSKEAGRLVHEITDKGVEWCMKDLVGGDAPTHAGPLARAHTELLRRVIGFLHRRGLLVEAVRPDDLESLIRAAYSHLAGTPEEWIRLARIRPRLNGAEKSEVDEVLLEMMKTGTVHLAPDSNTKMLGADDRAAAVRIGGEDLHLIAIEESS
ncbi:hypothetical protein [Lentzea sp. NPDC060358]|uniref:hypothetical protein n=1 Tax=Lentzea sp. NPDC060358 TaxID=3347103 RepID=UPI003653AE0E